MLAPPCPQCGEKAYISDQPRNTKKGQKTIRRSRSTVKHENQPHNTTKMDTKNTNIKCCVAVLRINRSRQENTEKLTRHINLEFITTKPVLGAPSSNIWHTFSKPAPSFRPPLKPFYPLHPCHASPWFALLSPPSYFSCTPMNVSARRCARRSLNEHKIRRN